MTSVNLLLQNNEKLKLMLKKAAFFCERLKKCGYECYVVGGAVRDAIINKPIYDIDLATSATPDETARIFSDLKTDLHGIKYGSVAVYLCGERYEITTFRKENGYCDRRRPDTVEFCNDIKTDLTRRDFTCNALAFDFSSGLIDCFGGINDIENKVLRAVGDPQLRLYEDSLRILRALRFYSVLGFIPDERLQNAIYNLREDVKFLSAERIYDEFKKILVGKYFYECFTRNYAVFSVILPELFATNCGMANPDENKTEIYAKKIAEPLKNFNEESFEIRFAVLFGRGDKNGETAAINTLKRFNAGKKTIKAVETCFQGLL